MNTFATHLTAATEVVSRDLANRRQSEGARAPGVGLPISEPNLPALTHQ